jgi:uncharacterized protein (DUF983 family)
MGIVAYCPQGHRTKLKDRYAGLRIRCPECGAKYWVAAAASAVAAEMLTWLTSGAATGKELVWRSDWTDWRPIDVVFPEAVGGGN